MIRKQLSFCLSKKEKERNYRVTKKLTKNVWKGTVFGRSWCEDKNIEIV